MGRHDQEFKSRLEYVTLSRGGEGRGGQAERRERARVKQADRLLGGQGFPFL